MRAVCRAHLLATFAASPSLTPVPPPARLPSAAQVISGELFPESWVELDAEVAAVEQRRIEAEERAAAVEFVVDAKP